MSGYPNSDGSAWYEIGAHCLDFQTITDDGDQYWDLEYTGPPGRQLWYVVMQFAVNINGPYSSGGRCSINWTGAAAALDVWAADDSQVFVEGGTPTVLWDWGQTLPTPVTPYASTRLVAGRSILSPPYTRSPEDGRFRIRWFNDFSLSRSAATWTGILNVGDRLGGAGLIDPLDSTQQGEVVFVFKDTVTPPLRLFGRDDTQGLIKSARLSTNTLAGNNPGSLQDNPAPRLAETGNVYL